ncbi:30S ribosomal protein S11 [Candidatus Vidania fulgoroideorum]
MKYYLFINSTFNNTIITLTNYKGDVISWESSGKNKFRGAKKSTPFAAQKSTEKIIKSMKIKGVNVVSVRIKGAGSGRDSVIRTLNSGGIFVESIFDITPIAHNGCRPPKKRRV